MDDVQQNQSEAYDFPYHYIPQINGSSFHSFRHWNWSLNYVSALRLVSDKIRDLGTRSHIDVGCGDGALVHYLTDLVPDVKLVGIDYDPRAIRFAQTLTPSADFICGDINQQQWPAPFDSASLIEVIEHIPPDALHSFLTGVHAALAPGARLIVTVPHENHPIQPKHYRHFNFATLRSALSDSFDVEEMFGFERMGRWKGAIRKLTNNRFMFVEVQPLNKLLLSRELRFRTTTDQGCGRIFAVARRKG